MSEVIGMHEAKSSLSQLVQRAAAGEVILIGPRGHAEAKLVAVDAPVRAKRQIGLLKGRLEVPSDFDAALPDSVLDSFEGKP
jgi:antitoxin (DNA-binding transcriptional repressor) of toxin-antitoxin stability system